MVQGDGRILRARPSPCPLPLRWERVLVDAGCDSTDGRFFGPVSGVRLDWLPLVTRQPRTLSHRSGRGQGEGERSMSGLFPPATPFQTASSVSTESSANGGIRVAQPSAFSVPPLNRRPVAGSNQPTRTLGPARAPVW